MILIPVKSSIDHGCTWNIITLECKGEYRPEHDAAQPHTFSDFVIRIPILPCFDRDISDMRLSFHNDLPCGDMFDVSPIMTCALFYPKSVLRDDGSSAACVVGGLVWSVPTCMLHVLNESKFVSIWTNCGVSKDISKEKRHTRSTFRALKKQKT